MRKRIKNSFLMTCFMIASASSVSLIGGLGLESIQDKLLPLVPLMMATPALNTMVGDYASVIAAHATKKENRTRKPHQLAWALLPSVLVNASAVSLFCLLIAFKEKYAMDAVFITKFLVFIFGSISAVVASMLIITVIVDKALEKKKANPDDVLIPIVTSVTDVMMLGLITAAAIFLF